MGRGLMGAPSPYGDDLDMKIEWVDEKGEKHLDSIRTLLETGNIREFQKWWVVTIYEKLQVPRHKPLTERDCIVMLDFLKMTINSDRYNSSMNQVLYEEEMRRRMKPPKRWLGNGSIEPFDPTDKSNWFTP